MKQTFPIRFAVAALLMATIFDACENDVECNGGVCVPRDGRMSCFCPHGFTGDACEISVVDLQSVNDQTKDLQASINTSWSLFCAFMIFFMQAGFGMLEAGSVRAKNTKNILTKNILDTAVASVCFWGFGYGFAYGLRKDSDGNGFIGEDDFFLSNTSDHTHWFISWSFVCVSVTIVSGSLAERCNLKAYVIFSALMAIIIYPTSAHWAWSEQGWLSPFRQDRWMNTNGYIDFAGSGIVHVVGGFCGLVGAYLIGARLGRFDDSHRKIEGHSVTMAALGTLILWFGWYGFNPGSVGNLTNGRAMIAAKVATTTTLAAACGGLTTLILRKFLTNTYDLPAVLNGLLGGLVSVTGPCAVVEPWAAAVIGIVGAVVYCGSVLLLEKMQIDDPLEAAAVHGFCGMWGVISTGLFATAENIQTVYGLKSKPDQYGLFYGGGGEQLGVQLLMLLCLVTWSVVTSYITFSFISRFVGFRVPREVEFEGLDRSEHGGHAYPEFEKIQFHGAGTGY
eukprot:TRINITY_DN6174_c0_g1_i1.p1 TRINITY_DN6174_c0_g1~~TRINITY_DN6174_c0_g1_i1.p1  ORF type:complete len:507 (+),score=87.93 TRINITY_DN6174_c0_g1_i1:90-1610(+)